MSDASFSSDPAPKKKSGTSIIVIVLVVILGGGLAMFLCCGGLAWFGVQQGMGQLGEAVKTQIQNDPVIQDKLGGLDKVSLNFTATGESSNQGANAMVFDVKGPKGSGTVVVSNTDGAMTLKTAEGEFPLQAKMTEADMQQNIEKNMK